MTADGLPARPLEQIGTELRAEVEAAEAAFAEAVAHAIRAGELLIEAKAAVPSGGWATWVEANFPGSYRTARLYMQLARNAEKVRGSISIRDAVGLLTERTPDTGSALPLTDPGSALPPEPRREDFDGPLAEANYLLARIEWMRDRGIAAMQRLLAESAAAMGEDPERGAAIAQAAATAISRIEAERRMEREMTDAEDDPSRLAYLDAEDAYARASAALDRLRAEREGGR